MNPRERQLPNDVPSRPSGWLGMNPRELDWERISSELDAQGNAVIGGLLTRAECAAIAALYAREDIFRSRVVMERHGYGRGEYKYFAHTRCPRSSPYFGGASTPISCPSRTAGTKR